MSVSKTDKYRDTNREWVLDPKNRELILDLVLNHGEIIVCPATKEEMEETDRFFAKRRAALAKKQRMAQQAVCA